jgi:hypothetical protein
LNAQVESRPRSASPVFQRMAQLLDIRLLSEADAVRIVAAGSRRRRGSRLRSPSDWYAWPAYMPKQWSCLVTKRPRCGGATPEDYLRDEKPIAPLQLSATDSGARLVEAHLRRTAHGLF